MFIFTVELLDCDPCSPVWKDEVCNRSVPALLRPRGSSGRHQVHLGFQTVGMSYGQSRSHFGCACVVPARVVGAKFFPGRCWFALQCTFDVLSTLPLGLHPQYSLVLAPISGSAGTATADDTDQKIRYAGTRAE